MRFFISYVNLRHHPSPRPRRSCAAAAARFGAGAARTGGVGNSCGQAACVPPRPARGQKTAKALQTLAFWASSSCFSPLHAPARQRRGICRLSRCFRRSTAMVQKSNMQVLPFKNSFIGIHLCQPDFMIFVGKTHKIQAAFSSFPAYRLL